MIANITEFITSIDDRILLFIQEYIRIPFLTPFVTFITSLGNAGILWIVISLLLLISKKTRRIGYVSILALLCSLLINNILLKNLVKRIRPYDRIPELIPLVKKPADYSFPSGHTGSSFASAWVLYQEMPGLKGIAALVLAALIGLSRLYVGVHYPSDVLVGMFTGIISGRLAEWIFYKKYKNVIATKGKPL